MIQSRVIMIAAVIGIAGALLLKQRGPNREGLRHSMSVALSQKAPEMPAGPIMRDPDGGQEQSLDNLRPDGGSVPAQRKEFSHSRQIAGYAELKSKIFASESEKRERKLLVRDPVLLRSLEGLLNTPDRTGEDDLQAVAIEILMEAWADPQARPIAEEVMRAVVEDPRVEDPALDLRSREILAANKGELIFHWTSLDPGKLSEVRAWLPGPVSEKVLENVRGLQDRNLAESAEEARYSAGIEQ
jgi:hypothetical protein